MKKITTLVAVLSAGLAFGQIQFSTIDVAATEDFSTYAGKGFSTSPTTGQLHSDNWYIKGFTDGTMNFGDTKTSGDFTGSSTNTTSSGGLNPFTDSFNPSDVNFGISPTTSDFVNGDLILRVKNNTGKTITSIDVAYAFEYLNNNPRTHTFDFSYSENNTSYTAVASLNDATPATPDGTAFWQSKKKTTTITGLSIPCGSYIYLKWNSVNTGANGSDEIGLDDISLTPHGTVASTCTTDPVDPVDPVDPTPGSGIGTHGGNFDDFADGDFTTSPTWTVNKGAFIIEGNSLKQNDTGAGSSSISTPSTTACSATWEFSASLDFNPSGSNYSDIYLMSDLADLTGNVNGYFVRVGGTPDEVSLFKSTNGSASVIIDGTDKTVETTPTVRVKVTRGANGEFELFRDLANGTTYVSEGTVTDNTHSTSAFFGFSNTYTSTRSDKFFFDDINLIGSSSCTPTGINGAALLDVSVSNNGVGVFTLSETADVIVYNILGSVIYSATNTNTINISALSSGSYFAMVSKDGKGAVVRLNK